jgi:POT family proton-dependent oligopeptide transporter
VHVPPRGARALEEVLSPEGRSTLGRLALLTLFIAFFWSLFDQASSRWVLQAQHLDRTIFGQELLASQVQAANPILVLAFVPLFSYGLFPLLDRAFGLTPLRKIGIGFFLAVLAFLVPAWIEARFATGAHVHVVWQLLAYVLLTAAEVFVSVTGLELFYTQAPPSMKSSVMALYMLSVAIGNAFTSGVNFFLRDETGEVIFRGASYYLFFAGAMLLTAIAFVPFARVFQLRTYLQEERA